MWMHRVALRSYKIRSRTLNALFQMREQKYGLPRMLDTSEDCWRDEISMLTYLASMMEISCQNATSSPTRVLLQTRGSTLVRMKLANGWLPMCVRPHPRAMLVARATPSSKQQHHARFDGDGPRSE